MACCAYVGREIIDPLRDYTRTNKSKIWFPSRRSGSARYCSRSTGCSQHIETTSLFSAVTLDQISRSPSKRLQGHVARTRASPAHPVTQVRLKLVLLVMHFCVVPPCVALSAARFDTCSCCQTAAVDWALVSDPIFGVDQRHFSSAVCLRRTTRSGQHTIFLRLSCRPILRSAQQNHMQMFARLSIETIKL